MSDDNHCEAKVVDRCLKNITTPEKSYGIESNVTSDQADEHFSEAEDDSSDSYVPSDISDSDSSESEFEEGVDEAGLDDHVTAEVSYNDVFFSGKKGSS